MVIEDVCQLRLKYLYNFVDLLPFLNRLLFPDGFLLYVDIFNVCRLFSITFLLFTVYDTIFGIIPCVSYI